MASTNSLVVIEECLDNLYRARRASLSHRAERFKEKQIRLGKWNPDGDSAASVPGKRYSDKTKWINIGALDGDDNEDDDEDDEQQILKELAVKFSAPPVKSAPFDVESARKMYQQNYSQDSVAEALLGDFCSDMQQLLHKTALLLDDDDYRADQCDSLIDKYFMDKNGGLDSLEPSKRIAEIKKIISSIIESFGTNGAKAVEREVEDLTQQLGLTHANPQCSSKMGDAPPSKTVGSSDKKSTQDNQDSKKTSVSAKATTSTSATSGDQRR